MTIRSRREVVTFNHPFQIRGIDRQLPAGAYEVVTDEGMTDGLSVAAFRRIATMMRVSAEGSRGLTMEVISIHSADLADPMHRRKQDLRADELLDLSAIAIGDVDTSAASVVARFRQLGLCIKDVTDE